MAVGTEDHKDTTEWEILSSKNCNTNKHTENKSKYIYTVFCSLSKNMLFTKGI